MLKYGIVEELGSVLGYTATSALVDWFGGNNVRVPLTAESDHALCKVLGEPAYKRLVSWMNEQALTNRDRMLWIPLGYAREVDRRDRMIVAMIEMGVGTKQIASLAGMSERHIQQVRVRAEGLGLIPLILKRAGIDGATGKPVESGERKTRGVAGNGKKKR